MNIYIDSARIRLLTDKNQVQKGRDQVYLKASSSKIWETYRSIRNGDIPGDQSIAFIVTDLEATLHELMEHFVLSEAAGGLVTKGNEVLFINRLKKWDIPKGKVEEKETPERAAVREVLEETGVRAELGELFAHTWHTYQRFGSDWIKKTYWYTMKSKYDQDIKPQTDEGIEEVRWIAREEIPQIVLPNTYPSLHELLDLFLAQGEQG